MTTSKEFYESYPLYRRFEIKVPSTLDKLFKPSLRMTCPTCKSDQTFVLQKEFWEGKGYTNFPSAGEIIDARFVCAGCVKFVRHFFIHIADDLTSMTKIGQYPAWELKGDKNIEKLLGEHQNYLRRGLVCESQGYGIGAYAYYRRIVEETIDQLLDQIPALMTGDELVTYNIALQKTKTTRVAAEKISIVKDLLPPILRPDEMNPLKVLHETLSEGLHAESDQECLRSAEVIREILIFLSTQIATATEAKKSFTAGMRVLLDKKLKT